MIAHLVDSDVSIDYLGRRGSIVDLIDRLSPTGVAISVVTYMEMYQGNLRSSASDESRVALRRFLVAAPVLPVTLEIAVRCAEIRAELTSRGRSVRPRALDLLIAATAIEHGLTLVTRNVADYQDVPGLRLLTPPASGPAAT